ncbi:MAG: Gfo/Idh/MocA family protein [Saccharospirillum sp.]
MAGANPAPLRIGIAGLGRGFMLLLPTLAAHPAVTLMAAFDPRADARQRFEQDFAGTTHTSFEALCKNQEVEAIYVASPHGLHRAQVELAARYGKHVLVEKPMALSIDDCVAMNQAMEDAGKVLLVGHSHSFDTPYRQTARMIQSGEVGAVRLIQAMNYTDFLYRPRRPEELDTEQGGGVVFSQAAHQVDIVRLLGGGEVVSVTAHTGQWDPARPTEGAYTALLTFANGAVANMTYSGYAHFDSDEFLGWRGELGQAQSGDDYGKARRLLASVTSPEAEAELKNRRAYGDALGLADTSLNGIGHNHFGFVLASCEQADLRPTPDGIGVYGHTEKRVVPLAEPDIPRREVIDEWVAAIRDGHPPIHSGAWGLATMEVCFAMLESARTGGTVTLAHQCAVPDIQ